MFFKMRCIYITMSWLDNYSTTNTFRSMYINGFMDISGGLSSFVI